jgi:hypothetical protein
MELLNNPLQQYTTYTFYLKIQIFWGEILGSGQVVSNVSKDHSAVILKVKK